MSAAAPSTQEYKRLTQYDVDVICAKHDRLWSARMGGARAVFAFCDLSGLSMTGRNLCDADFTGAMMVGCDLRKTKLDNANCYGADMQGADLTDASMRRADLRGSSLRGANLTGADMFEADLREGT
ncbi:MAG TPA: pentapeptide repeat-containing protein, partial [Caulobacter sp.]|nr:pentapeptide repeat-containing protein [Caulobacter sp.]